MKVEVTVDGVTVTAKARNLTIKEAREGERQPFPDGLLALFEETGFTRDGDPCEVDDLLEVEAWALFGGRQRALIEASIRLR